MFSSPPRSRRNGRSKGCEVWRKRCFIVLAAVRRSSTKNARDSTGPEMFLEPHLLGQHAVHILARIGFMDAWKSGETDFAPAFSRSARC